MDALDCHEIFKYIFHTRIQNSLFNFNQRVKSVNYTFYPRRLRIRSQGESDEMATAIVSSPGTMMN